jgi:hypothetical protein
MDKLIVGSVFGYLCEQQKIEICVFTLAIRLIRAFIIMAFFLE